MLIELSEDTVGKVFDDTSMLHALKDTLKYGTVASLPLLLKGFPYFEIVHELYPIADSMDLIGVDEEGKFAEKGEPIIITVHGKTVLCSPKRLKQMYNKQASEDEPVYSEDIEEYVSEKYFSNVYGAAELTRNELNDILYGDLFNKPPYSYNEFLEETASKELDPTNIDFAVVRTIDLAKKTELRRYNRDYMSSLATPEEIFCDRSGKVIDSQLIVYAGGIQEAQNFIERLQKWHFSIEDTLTGRIRDLDLDSCQAYGWLLQLDSICTPPTLRPEPKRFQHTDHVLREIHHKSSCVIGAYEFLNAEEDEGCFVGVRK